MSEAKPHPKPARKPDDRVEVWGSTLKARPGGLKRTAFKAKPSKLYIGAPELKPTNVRARKRSTKAKGRSVVGVTPEMRSEVFQRANGRCQADGLHHPNCPGELPPFDWSAHHVQPRSKGGQDELDNLIAVWCPMGLGLNGCHGTTHGNPTLAKALGLLKGRDT